VGREGGGNALFAARYTAQSPCARWTTIPINTMAEEVHDDDKGEEVSEKDLEAEPLVHFEPLVKLQEVKVQTHEEDEDILFKMFVSLFCYLLVTHVQACKVIQIL
jgi:hypothetical protein